MGEDSSKLWYLASSGAAVLFSAPGYGYGQRVMPKELLQSTERCQESSCNNWCMSMSDLFCLKLDFSLFVLSN